MMPCLYNDDDYLIIDKPAGLAVQGGAGVRVSVPDVVKRDYGFTPFLVHRLDKDTSGCLALAKSSAAAARLSTLLADSRAKKIYRALVRGRMEQPSGVFTHEVAAHGKKTSARTRYRLLKSNGVYSLIEAELDTGRMHQIRQHVAQAGHPILGDDTYGDFALNKALRKTCGLKKMLLYAAELHIPLDPPVRTTAAAPRHFVQFLELWEDPTWQNPIRG